MPDTSRSSPASADTLPAATTLGAVHLTVTDLDRALEYYVAGLGMALRQRAGDVAHLGAGGADLLVLAGDRSAQRAHGVTGLFHLAILVPSRADLGRALAHLLAASVPLDGAADHGVSEALYLSDPEGNGIEIYRDRDRAEWPVRDGRLAMTTDPLDHEGILAAGADGEPGEAYALSRGTVIGHVHLRVSRLEPTERFYRDIVGLDVMQRWGNSALFMSAGGYHHHLGLNTWAGVGLKAPPPGAQGLRCFEVRLPDHASLDALVARAAAAGVPAQATGDGTRVADPSGNVLAFVVA